VKPHGLIFERKSLDSVYFLNLSQHIIASVSKCIVSQCSPFLRANYKYTLHLWGKFRFGPFSTDCTNTTLNPSKLCQSLPSISWALMFTVKTCIKIQWVKPPPIFMIVNLLVLIAMCVKNINSWYIYIYIKKLLRPLLLFGSWNIFF
jgi:hypothetical protein